ncbi:hypothetical protein EK21DRAFT_53093 [Setomelanomma holmii]|uniref:Uncharacterized protein n=1 Tax=Setomelanomma holmii TaxID=210430 RepID=A0A9P4LUU7_9PLEO|nr:hypothetical protein EK21DRAFT_53093 [Setomelanomma holmii]
MKLLTTLTALMATATASSVRTVFQFPNSTWLENLALTRNHSLLVTVIGRPEVHLIYPHLQHDIFAVAVGTTTPANAPIEGSFSIWTIDVSDCSRPATVHKIVDLPTVSMVNGLTLSPPNTLLLADSWAGNIVGLNLKTRTYSVVLQDESLEANFSAPLPLGVNGLRYHLDPKTHTDYIYYSNFARDTIGRVKVNSATGHATGPFEIIAQGESVGGPDDLAVLDDGSVLVVRPLVDRFEHVHLNGTVSGGLDVSGGTSVVLAGKGKGEERKVYVSTSGLVGGVSTGKGGVVEVEL